jgi:sugar-specific transcriptional regulator TrmB
MSKNIDLNILSGLSDLGLSEKEALIYAVLVAEGEASAITLARVANLHRQFVYNALENLRAEGLVMRVGDTRAKWRALSPRRLVARAEEQEQKALAVSEMLLALQTAHSGQEFEVVEGVTAFRQRLATYLRKVPRHSSVRMLAGAWDKYFEHAGERAHAEWDRLRVAKGITFRIIGPESMRARMEEARRQRGLVEFRIFAGLNNGLVNTVVYGDTVDLEIFGDPHLTFSITNPDVAQSQRNYFESLWKLGEEGE